MDGPRDRARLQIFTQIFISASPQGHHKAVIYLFFSSGYCNVYTIIIWGEGLNHAGFLDFIITRNYWTT